MRRLSSRALVVPVLLLAGGCSSSGRSDPVVNSSPEMTRTDTPIGKPIQIDWTSDHTIIATDIPASAAKVYALLPEMYGELGVSPGTVDSEARVFGNTNFEIRRQIGNVRLSKYLSCGEQMGMPTADTYDIQMSIISKVVATDSTTSSLRTQVEGRAYPEGVSGHVVACSTTGELEQRLAKMVLDRVMRS